MEFVLYSGIPFNEVPLHFLATVLTVFVFDSCRSMSSCARQLFTLHEKNLKYGPVHIQTKPRGQAPTPLVPMSLSTGENFVSHKATAHNIVHPFSLVVT